MRRPAEFTDFPEELVARAPFGPYRAIVARVVDGDTLDVLLDLGLNTYRYEALRLRGVDAPELYRGTPEERVRGRAARDHLLSLAQPRTPCVVATFRNQESFGRYVADVTLEGGRDLAELMVASGHATRGEA